MFVRVIPLCTLKGDIYFKYTTLFPIEFDANDFKNSDDSIKCKLYPVLPLVCSFELHKEYISITILQYIFNL